jgi:hypothetical protein
VEDYIKIRSLLIRPQSVIRTHGKKYSFGTKLEEGRGGVTP